MTKDQWKQNARGVRILQRMMGMALVPCGPINIPMMATLRDKAQGLNLNRAGFALLERIHVEITPRLTALRARHEILDAI